MGQIKLTPLRLDCGIYAWAVILMTVFTLQVANFTFQIFESEAKELLNFYSFLIVVIGMLSVWISSWQIDSKESKGVAYCFLIWLNFLIFSILAILLFVNTQQGWTISAIAIVSVTSIGNIGALIYALLGKFNRNIEVVECDDNKSVPLRINNSIYYWLATMLIAFYLIVFHKVLDLLSEEVINYISFGSFVMSFWLVSDFARKSARVKWLAADDAKAVSGSIIKWVWVLCATLIWNCFVLDVIESFGLVYIISICVSCILNTFFLVLLLMGKFKIEN